MGRYNTHEDFLSRLKVDGECLVWTGSINASGYGMLGLNKVVWYTHRYSYTHYVGDIPKGLFVLHSCDNRPCVLPSHLRVGTQAENVADMDARGRRTRKSNDKECERGHLREEHTHVDPKTQKRQCRACGRINYKKRVARNRT